VEGADRALFDKLTKELNWEVLPQTAAAPVLHAVGSPAAGK
jgi:hypothetical protein